jgi:ParB/RepB/Spo0J family partition protein
VTQVQEIAIARIVPGDNDREAFDSGGLRELADSIGQYGLAQPITVRPVGSDRYQIVAGERRWRACRLLAWATIPALVREMDDEQASGVMLLENIQRAELNPIEEARAYAKRMEQFGWDAERVAAAANVPVGRVRLRLTLLDIVPEAQALVRSGQLGIKYAYVMRDLDANRQRIALQYLSEVDTPRLSEFRRLCARLLAEQAQAAMFDMAVFMTRVQETRADEAANRPARVIPVAKGLPAMRKARSVGHALERYIRDLLDEGDEDAARVVGSVYLGLLQHKLTQMPEG